MMMKALIKVALTHLHETSSHASQLMNIRDDPSTASFAAVLLSLYWLITQQPRNQRLEQRICAGSIWHKHFKVKGGLGDRIRSDYHQCVCECTRTDTSPPCWVFCNKSNEPLLSKETEVRNAGRYQREPTLSDAELPHSRHCNWLPCPKVNLIAFLLLC